MATYLLKYVDPSKTAIQYHVFRSKSEKTAMKNVNRFLASISVTQKARPYEVMKIIYTEN